MFKFAKSAGVAACAVAVGLTITTAPAQGAQGSGNPQLHAAPTTLPATGGTITVSGLDYLVPPHAPGANVFGGVYVFFGWVRPGGAWGPSIRNSNNNDGTYGNTYNYAGNGGDAGTREDPDHKMAFVAFTSGGASGTATTHHMDDNSGNWPRAGESAVQVVVPGPVYEYENPVTSQKFTVDCRVVQCGVFTIGAHGKASATNETFTPVNFAAPVTPTTKGTPVTRPNGGGNNNGGGSNNDGGNTGGNGGAVAPGGTAPGATTAAGGPPTTTKSTTQSSTVAKDKKDKAAKAAAAKKKKHGSTSGSADEEESGKDADQIALAPVSSTSEQGVSVGWIVLGVLAVLGVGGGVFLLTRRRLAAAGTSPEA